MNLRKLADSSARDYLSKQVIALEKKIKGIKSLIKKDPSLISLKEKYTKQLQELKEKLSRATV